MKLTSEVDLEALIDAANGMKIETVVEVVVVIRIGIMAIEGEWMKVTLA
jgi:hypothetical protein